MNIVKLFDNLLTIATDLEASDIHIEPYETYCRIRIRIDGIMYELIQYPNSIHENIIAKFKIESGQMSLMKKDFLRMQGFRVLRWHIRNST